MTTIKEIKKQNKISASEFDSISKIVLDSFLLDVETKDISQFQKKKELLDIYKSFISKYLELKFVHSKEEKLTIIRFLDKLNLQKELLDLSEGLINLSDIKSAAKSLGRKSQSAFKIK
jgi:transcription initiation factor TFIIIB Brf1 subunit/transcription initiation factor TFIIB